MRKIGPYCLLLLYCYLVSSCQKEIGFPDGQSGNRSIIGNYDFVSLTASVESIVTNNSGPLQEKIITSSNYTTINNSGTVSITNTQFNTTAIAYSVNAIAHGEIYEAGILMGSLDYPFSFDLPATDGSSDYRVITSDSLFFENGLISYDPTGTGAPTTALPIGARTSWSGDTLILKAVFNQSGTQDLGGGIIAQVIASGRQTIRLKKK